MITAHQYHEFMQKLLTDARGKNPLLLTEWEGRFVGSFAQAPRQTLWLTARRTVSVDKMWRRYGAELNWPHPLDQVTERSKIPDADENGCEYLVRDEGRQSRCNESAEFQEPGRLRYCRMHAEAVELAMKRAGKKLSLIAFNPKNL